MADFSYGDHKVALRPDTDPRSVAAAVEAARRTLGSVVLSFRAQDRLPHKLVAAAADALGPSDDAMVYVVGDAKDFAAEEMLPFRQVQHVNLNVRNLSTHEFLADFTALQTLTIQGSPTSSVPLGFLAALHRLTSLTIPGAVGQANTLAKCAQLQILRCSSSKPVLEALVCHPALEFLDITFGTNRDLSALPTIPSLRGLALFQIRSLTGNDLAPLGHCHALQALSLGALRNVTQLSALQGKPRHTLRALLLESLPNLQDLSDVAGCEVLTQLGLYESRPKDGSLQPLRRLGNLTHLVLGDAYAASEINALNSYYTGALHYRNKIERGEFKPRWRTPINKLP